MDSIDPITDEERANLSRWKIEDYREMPDFVKEAVAKYEARLSAALSRLSEQDKLLAECEEAIEAVVQEYNDMNPLRTADQHSETCTCIRCKFDNAEALLTKLKQRNGG